MSAFFKWYTTSVKRSPKLTNGIMTGSLFGIGDAVAQVFFPENGKKKYDAARTFRAVFYGSIIFAPIGDKWYKFLNGKIVLKPGENWINNIARVLCDQLIFAPACIPVYYGVMTLFEGKSIASAKEKIQNNFSSTLVTNWYVWPWVQLLNFSVVPVHHRLLTVNFVAIFWNTFLSIKNSKVTDDNKKIPVNYPPIPE